MVQKLPLYYSPRTGAAVVPLSAFSCIRQIISNACSPCLLLKSLGKSPARASGEQSRKCVQLPITYLGQDEGADAILMTCHLEPQQEGRTCLRRHGRRPRKLLPNGRWRSQRCRNKETSRPTNTFLWDVLYSLTGTAVGDAFYWSSAHTHSTHAGRAAAP